MLPRPRSHYLLNRMLDPVSSSILLAAHAISGAVGLIQEVHATSKSNKAKSLGEILKALKEMEEALGGNLQYLSPGDIAYMAAKIRKYVVALLQHRTVAEPIPCRTRRSAHIAEKTFSRSEYVQTLAESAETDAVDLRVSTLINVKRPDTAVDKDGLPEPVRLGG